MAAAAILDFWNREILLATGVHRIDTHRFAKYCQNWSIVCDDIDDFSIFQDGGAAILDFRNREFLFAVGIWSA